MKITWSPAVTLDGYIAKSDGNSDWVSDKDGELFSELIREAGCVIVGHRTYEEYKGQVFPVEGAITYVWTRYPKNREPTAGVKFISGSPEEVVKKLEADGHQSAVLAGGGKTNNAFVGAGMVNEIAVTIYPLIFGDGIRLLSEKIDLDLELFESKEIGAGIIRQHYIVK